MKKLKIILLCSLSLATIIYVNYKINNVSYQYKEKVNSLKGIVTDISYYDNKVSLIVKAKENILVNDYKFISNVKLGDYVEVKGEMKLPQENTNFNLFNYRKYLLSKKIFHTFTLSKIKVLKSNNFIYSFKNKLVERLDSIDNSYLYPFIMADNRIDKETYYTYQINGISHLFAISGSHITLISFTLLFILNKFIKKRKISYIITSIFLLFYMFLTGFTAPVIRSCLLFIFLTIFKIFNIKIRTFIVLFLILIILLIYNPYYIYDIGFMYSFSISFALIIFSNHINKFNNYFVKLFITSLIAYIVSIPITVNNTFSINLLSPILNIIFIPFISFIIFPLALITFTIPQIDSILMFFIKILENMSFFFYNYKIELILSYIPLYGIIIYYLIIGFLLYKPNKISVLLFVFLICFHYNINLLRKYPTLSMIDVGQGDSLLISLPYNKGNILVDTGGNINYDIAKNTVIPFLKSRGIKKLDYLILSHGDFDHMGASINLIKNFQVAEVIMNSGATSENEKELKNLLKKMKLPYTEISKKIINVGDNKFYFLNDVNELDENGDSLILYAQLNNYKLLFMGDATINEEETLIRNFEISNIDIIKVGHHGSKYSTGADFIENINPKYALVSVGAKNYYGHPSDRVVDLLKQNKIDTLYSSKNGSVILELASKIKIEKRFD